MRKINEVKTDKKQKRKKTRRENPKNIGQEL